MHCESRWLHCCLLQSHSHLCSLCCLCDYAMYFVYAQMRSRCAFQHLQGSTEMSGLLIRNIDGLIIQPCQHEGPGWAAQLGGTAV